MKEEKKPIKADSISPTVEERKPLKIDIQPKNEFLKAFEAAGVIPSKIAAKVPDRPSIPFTQKLRDLMESNSKENAPKQERKSSQAPVSNHQPAPQKDFGQKARKGDEHRNENMSALRSALSQVLSDTKKKENPTPIPETLKNFAPKGETENSLLGRSGVHSSKLSDSHQSPSQADEVSPPPPIKVSPSFANQSSKQNNQKINPEPKKEKSNSNEVSPEVLKAILHGGNLPKSQ